MNQTIVLIDANNFYASCEQMIDPKLIKKPLIILSNNDGCIISRSAEARAISIPMGEPYFKCRKIIEASCVEVRTANYSLYGDISNRLMKVIRDSCIEIEQYSIDEAFACINIHKRNEVHTWAQSLRERVLQFIGIAITIGVGRNKVEAKIATRIAKESPTNAGIFDIRLRQDKDKILNKFKIEHIWGIGKANTVLLNRKGIYNAKDLREANSSYLKNRLGINILRIKQELNGVYCHPIKESKIDKKEVMVSRSFTKPIDNLEQLKKSIRLYLSIACRKLRKYNKKTSHITIFAMSSIYKSEYFFKEKNINLKFRSNNDYLISKIILPLVNEIYNPKYHIKKTGIVMRSLSSGRYNQLSLAINGINKESSKEKNLMSTIDNLNNKYGNDTLKWGMPEIIRSNKSRRELSHNPSFTNIKALAIAWAE